VRVGAKVAYSSQHEASSTLHAAMSMLQACCSQPEDSVTSCRRQLRLLHRILRLAFQLGCVTDASESIAPTPPPTVRHDRPPKRTRSTALHAIAAAAGTLEHFVFGPDYLHHQPVTNNPPPPPYRREISSKVPIERQRRHAAFAQAHALHQQTASAAATAATALARSK
jgi:hypothetical protein